MIHFRHDERTPRPGPPRRDDRCGRRPGLCARPRNSPSKSRGPPEEKIGQAIYDTYRPQSVEEIQTALKKIFAPIFEAALKGELKNHLGYPKNGTNPEKSGNSRNGYSMKTMSQRDIASTIEDIYSFSISHEQISHITDCILDEVYEG